MCDCATLFTTELLSLCRWD
jgi:DNA-directed RNA polymerase subunit E'/Rpb7